MAMTKDAKRKAKKKKLAKSKSLKLHQMSGRLDTTSTIYEAEWGILVHQPSLSVDDLHPLDKGKACELIRQIEDSGERATIKRRKGGSYVILECPQTFETADVAYDDGLVDPIDIIIENDLPATTKFLGFVVCDGDGKFLANDGGHITVPERAYMFESIPDADKVAQTYDYGFTTMVFEIGSTIITAVVKPS
ncbi:hypothetical protein ACSTJQ_12715 [Vibrio parahaemolyticus]